MEQKIRRHETTRLLEAKAAAATITRPSSEHASFDLEDGYAVMANLDQELVKRDYNRVGRKIGFTNRETWVRFNLSTPIWAYVYDKTFTHSESGEFTFQTRGSVAPKIETEVVLWIGDRISGKNRDIKALADSIDAVSIGFEIVACHYPDWEITSADAVADFGMHTHLFAGPKMPVAGAQKSRIIKQIESFKVGLRKNGDPIGSGVGKNALGSPLLALGYLVDVLADQPWAPPLEPGEAITTGTLTPLFSIAPGDRWSVGIEGIEVEPIELAVV